MIEVLIDYCIYEDVPVEQSITYNSIKDFHGKDFAQQFTYERGMNGSAELREVMQIITGGVAPGGRIEDSGQKHE